MSAEAAMASGVRVGAGGLGGGGASLPSFSKAARRRRMVVTTQFLKLLCSSSRPGKVFLVLKRSMREARRFRSSTILVMVVDSWVGVSVQAVTAIPSLIMDFWEPVRDSKICWREICGRGEAEEDPLGLLEVERLRRSTEVKMGARREGEQVDSVGLRGAFRPKLKLCPFLRLCEILYVGGSGVDPEKWVALGECNTIVMPLLQ